MADHDFLDIRSGDIDQINEIREVKAAELGLIGIEAPLTKLARLSEIEYEQQLKDEAKRLP